MSLSQKRNEILTSIATWTSLKGTMLSEGGPRGYGAYDSLYTKCWDGQIHRDRKQVGGFLGGWGSDCLVGAGLLLGDEMLWNEIEVMFAQHCECAKCH